MLTASDRSAASVPPPVRPAPAATLRVVGTRPVAAKVIVLVAALVVTATLAPGARLRTWAGAVAVIEDWPGTATVPKVLGGVAVAAGRRSRRTRRAALALASRVTT